MRLVLLPVLFITCVLRLVFEPLATSGDGDALRLSSCSSSTDKGFLPVHSIASKQPMPCAQRIFNPAKRTDSSFFLLWQTVSGLLKIVRSTKHALYLQGSDCRIVNCSRSRKCNRRDRTLLRFVLKRDKRQRGISFVVDERTERKIKTNT